MGRRLPKQVQRTAAKMAGWRVQLQQSTKTGHYRAKIVLDSGEVYAVGEIAPDPLHARLTAIAAAKQKTWDASPMKDLLDRLEAGTPTAQDLRELGL